MVLRFACLVLAALGMAAPAAAEWSRAVSQHFVIYSDQPPEKLKAYAERLEAFDQAVRYARHAADPLPGPANKLTIYAVEDLAAVQRIYGGGGVGGFYLPRAGDTVAFVPLSTSPGSRLDITPEAVFFHEYAHHLMYQNSSGAIPLWLSEGFAEFFSTAKFESDGSIGLGAPAAHRAEILLAKLYAPLPLPLMLGGTYKDLRHYYLEEVYGRGWLLTHYLTFNAGRKGQLERYLAAIQQGKPAMQAASDAFGDLRKLELELKQYVRSTRFPYVTVPPSKFKVGAVSVERLSQGQGAMIEVVMQSRRGITEEQAAKLAPFARRIAAAFPADAVVQAALAEAELNSKNYDEAIAAADRALASDPRSVNALLRKGYAQMAKAEKAASAGTDWKPIRSLFLRANKLDPEDPRPLVGYYETFRTSKAAVPPAALEGLVYAFELAPHDPDVRWTVMRELVAQGRGPEAAKALKPLAYAPHGGKFAERAQAVLDAVEAGDFTAARQKVEEADKAQKEAEEKARKKRH